MAYLLYKWLFLSLLSFGVPEKSVPEKGAHPFYVSVLEVNHNREDKSLEISSKVFTEDLEEILRKNYKSSVDLANKSQEPANARLIQDYLSKHLSFLVDGKPVKMNYVGFEIDGESIYTYFELPGVPSLKKLDINNSILHDFKPEQINIMHITVNGSRKSYKLDFPKTQASFSF